MIRKPQTIPDSFQRLDSQVTAADSFVNCRDMQVARANHNILVARRVQQTIFTCAFTGQLPGGEPLLYTVFRTRLQPEQDESEILRMKIFVPQWTQQLRLKFDACKASLSEGSENAFDPIVYADVWNPYARKPTWPPPSATVVAAHGSPATYSIDINVPQTTAANTSHAGRREFEFGVWVKCSRDTTQNILSAGSISDVSPSSVTAATASSLIYNSLTVSTDTGIEARQIVKQIDMGAGVYQLVTDRPFSRLPDVNNDTIDVNEIAGLDLYSASLRCLPVSSSAAEFSL
jgi:hypothetical protein